MKMIKVVVERWLEVPDDWDLVEPEYTDQVHLQTAECCLVPELTWLILKDHSEETVGWEEIDAGFKETLGNMMTAGANSLEVELDEEEETEPDA